MKKQKLRCAKASKNDDKIEKMVKSVHYKVFIYNIASIFMQFVWNNLMNTKYNCWVQRVWQIKIFLFHIFDKHQKNIKEIEEKNII